MAKPWHVAVVACVVIFVASVAAVESGIPITLEGLMPLIALGVLGGGVYVGYRVIKRGDKERRPEGIRGGIIMDEAKFIAANHLLRHHGLDVFATGTTPKTAKYTVNLIADRCYPSPGEEAWHVRLKVRDKRFFSGFLSRIIIYMDGAGNVTDDPIMNELTFRDDELWRDPSILFIRRPPKTAKPRALSEIIAARVEEKGEFPTGFTPGQLEEYKREE